MTQESQPDAKGEMCLSLPHHLNVYEHVPSQGNIIINTKFFLVLLFLLLI